MTIILIEAPGNNPWGGFTPRIKWPSSVLWP
jgi:hypothetical protein